MRLLFVLTLFVLVLLATCGRLERYTTKEFDKILEKEEKEFFKFMKVKKTKDGMVRIADGARFNYKRPTEEHINKLKEKIGKDAGLRPLIMTSLVLRNLVPKMEECKGIGNKTKRAICRQKKRAQMLPYFDEYFGSRMESVGVGEKLKFRSNIAAILDFYAGELSNKE
jgi:hypothetical protein